MDLIDKAKSLVNEALINKKQLFGFAAATGGSYLCGLIATEFMRRSGYPNDINAVLTWIARTGSFYAINLPYHFISHKNDYKNNIRDMSKEAKVISSSNAVGTFFTLIQKPAHEFLMDHTQNQLAYLSSYLTIGAMAAGIKFGIDRYFGVYKKEIVKE